MQKGKARTFRFRLPVSFLKEGKTYVSYSPALDLSSCGRTLEEARKNFIEAVEIFFEECEAMGTLDEVLEASGWVKRPKKNWEPPVQVAEELVEIPAVAVG